MVQEGVDLTFVVKGARAATVVESDALLPPPPLPTGPLQQHHGREHARLHPRMQRASDKKHGTTQRPLPLPLPHNIDWYGVRPMVFEVIVGSSPAD